MPKFISKVVKPIVKPIVEEVDQPCSIMPKFISKVVVIVGAVGVLVKIVKTVKPIVKPIGIGLCYRLYQLS